MPDPPLEGPAGHVSRSSDGNGLIYVLVGLGLLAMIAAGVAAMFFVNLAQTSYTPILEEFLAAAERRQYDQAYAMTSGGFQAATIKEVFRTTFDAINGSLGRHTELSMESLVRTPGSVQISYQSKFEKGAGTLNVTFAYDGGAWCITELEYDTPQAKQSIGSGL